MTTYRYRRVSKRRLCIVCGKPDWCSTNVTETISFCARSILNADRISQCGWGVYYHDGSRSGVDVNFRRRFNRIPKEKKIDGTKALALPELRDKVYRKLIELAPALSNRKMVCGQGGLLERGIQNLSQYGSLTGSVNERRILVERLVEVLGKEGIQSFEGVPGFWRDSDNLWRLWSKQDSFDNLMLIPFIGSDGLIQACQIRFMRYVPNRSGRYVWLSSLKEKDGCGPGAPLHHADPHSQRDKPVLVTEGALKAATAQKFLPGRYVVGNSGVATSHREIVETARRKPLEIAFDNDSFTNPHVARALAALIGLRLADQRSSNYEDKVRVLTWDRSIKGIDEALLSGHRFVSITVTAWLKELSAECLEQAKQQLPDL